MMFRLVRELAEDGFDVAVACRVLGVARSSYYDWASRPASPRSLEDARLTKTIRRIHYDSRCTYGAPRVHAELRIGLGLAIGRKRVARLMRDAGIQGVCHGRKRRGWKPEPATQADLVQRKFTADAPDRVWFTDLKCRRRHLMSYADVRTMPMLSVMAFDSLAFGVERSA